MSVEAARHPIQDSYVTSALLYCHGAGVCWRLRFQSGKLFCSENANGGEICLCQTWKTWKHATWTFLGETVDISSKEITTIPLKLIVNPTLLLLIINDLFGSAIS